MGGGSFRNAFVTVLLLHVFAVLGMMAYGSLKKASATIKTAKQAEQKEFDESKLPAALRGGSQRLLATVSAEPGARLEPIREKDPFLTESEKSEKTKPTKLVSKFDEPLPPLAPPSMKPIRPPAVENRKSAASAKTDNNESAKRAFLEATGRSAKVQENHVVTEPEIRKGEPLLRQAEELPTQTMQKVAPAPSEYVVGGGDNIYTVSKRLNVSYAELAKANNLASPRDLRVGQTLVVPRGDSL